METHFENIRERLIEELNRSEFIIQAAVAWITDFHILSTLIDRLKSGIKIELIVNDDETFAKRVKQFDEFRQHGGDLFLFKNDRALMHNKFCVVDLCTTITGSFNWSFNAATLNRENVIIVRDDLTTAKSFAREFKNIKKCSVLFEGRKTFYDLISYGEVTSHMLTGDDDEKWIQIIVEEGKKMGIVYFEYTFVSSKIPIPTKLLGYWKEKQLDNRGEDMIINDKTLYCFEVSDPLYDQFAYK